MRRNGHFRTSGYNSRWIRRCRFLIRREYFGNRNRNTIHFQLFLHFIARKCAIFILPVYVTYFRIKLITHSPAEGDDFYKIWSWSESDHPLPTYEAFTANTLRYIVTFMIDLLTLNGCREFLVTWSNPPPNLSVLRRSILELWCSQSDVLTTNISRVIAYWPLRMRNITWPICKGLSTNHIFWNPWPLFLYSLCNFCDATVNINKWQCYPPK